MIEPLSFTIPAASAPDGSEITVRGLIGVPDEVTASSPAPAVLHIHGGGQTTSRENVAFFCSHGYVCMSFDWTGLHPDRPADEVTRYPQWMDQLPKQDVLERVRDSGLASLPQFQAVAIASACLDRLESDPRVMADRMGVYGVSWGGLIAWIVNGTDPRIRCAVPVYGVGGLRERDNSYSRAWNDLPDTLRHQWARTMEPLAFVTRQHGSVLYVGATNDFFGSPETVARLTSLSAGAVRADYSPNMDHCFEAGSARSVTAFFAHHLNNGPALPPSPQIRVIREGIDMRVTSDADDRSRVVWYTRATVPATERSWTMINMEPTADGSVASFPADDQTPVFCFVRTTDAKGATLCSDILYVPRVEESGGEHRPGHGTEITDAIATEERTND